MRTRGGQALRSVPYPQELNDIPMIVARQNMADFAQMVVDNLDEMLGQSQSHGQAQALVMGIALHPYIALNKCT